MQLNNPEALAGMKAAFDRYELALNENDVSILDDTFRVADETVRYGVNEHLYGHAEIAVFRAARPPQAMRQLCRTHFTTYGPDYGIAWVEFTRPGMTRMGRQTQTWVRFSDEGQNGGWKVVAAHVSLVG